MCLNKPRILIVEDNSEIARLWEVIAESQGWAHELARDGREAMKIYAHAKTDLHPFDLVLLDCALPGLSGFEVAQKMKSSEPSLPIIMMTAYDDDFMKAHAHKVKADELLFKPIDPTVLIAKVEELLAAN